MFNNELAAPELGAVDVEGISREAFIMRATVAAGSIYGLSTVGPFVRQAIAQDAGSGDVGILNFALTLEFLEAAFYTEAVRRVPGLKTKTKEVATTLRDSENEHVDALTTMIKDLGGKPVQRPGVDFGGALASEASFLELSQTFEDLGVAAYNGAAPEIRSKKVLAAAGGIVQVEARHAAIIRSLRGEEITTAAFDPVKDRDEVLAAAKPFIKG